MNCTSTWFVRYGTHRYEHRLYERTDVRTRGILKVFSVMFSTLLRPGFVLVRQSIVLCSQEWFER